jgi:hypothetical protein
MITNPIQIVEIKNFSTGFYLISIDNKGLQLDNLWLFYISN